MQVTRVLVLPRADRVRWLFEVVRPTLWDLRTAHPIVFGMHTPLPCLFISASGAQFPKHPIAALAGLMAFDDNACSERGVMDARVRGV